MNKAWVLWLVAGALLASRDAAKAAEMVKFPEGNVSWTVTFTPLVPPKTENHPGAEPSPTPPKVSQRLLPKQVEVTIVDKVKRIRITWANGKTSEEWTLPGLPVILKENARDGEVFPIQSGQAEAKFDKYYTPYDASDFAWATPANLKSSEPVDFRGKKCYHFESVVAEPTISVQAPSGSKPGGSRSDSRNMKREAWIDSETLLPVALATDKSLCLFNFPAEPPAGPLVMPAKFAKELAYYKKVMGMR